MGERGGMAGRPMGPAMRPPGNVLTNADLELPEVLGDELAALRIHIAPHLQGAWWCDGHLGVRHLPSG